MVRADSVVGQVQPIKFPGWYYESRNYGVEDKGINTANPYASTSHQQPQGTTLHSPGSVFILFYFILFIYLFIYFFARHFCLT
jgi:hypothetical protein